MHPPLEALLDMQHVSLAFTFSDRQFFTEDFF